jgi:hypothetical protein
VSVCAEVPHVCLGVASQWVDLPPAAMASSIAKQSPPLQQLVRAGLWQLLACCLPPASWAWWPAPVPEGSCHQQGPAQPRLQAPRGRLIPGRPLDALGGLPRNEQGAAGGSGDAPGQEGDEPVSKVFSQCLKHQYHNQHL